MVKIPDKKIGRFVVPWWLPGWMRAQIEKDAEVRDWVAAVDRAEKAEAERDELREELGRKNRQR